MMDYGGMGYGGGVGMSPMGMGMGMGRMGRPPPSWAYPIMMDPLPGNPIGLEYLTLCDTILVQQLVEFVEIMTGYETANRYILRNPIGQQIYYAFEESNPSSRQCSGTNRAFSMHIVDNFNREVCRINRPNACCGRRAIIESPPGIVASRIGQDCGCCGCNFTIYDDVGIPMFKVIGPCCVGCCPPGEFPIVAHGGGEVGRVTKIWTNLAQELCMDADTFGVQFPINMHPAMKAVLIGTTFLIDFMYFEEKGGVGDMASRGMSYGYGDGYAGYVG